jgi:hypothetical protein
LLADVKRLRRSARSARHAYWFPLVLFSVLTFAAVPFYVMPKPPSRATTVLTGSGTQPMPWLGGAPASHSQAYLGYYWLVALLAGLTLTLFWYRRHARRIGVATPSRGYLRRPAWSR